MSCIGHPFGLTQAPHPPGALVTPPATPSRAWRRLGAAPEPDLCLVRDPNRCLDFWCMVFHPVCFFFCGVGTGGGLFLGDLSSSSSFLGGLLFEGPFLFLFFLGVLFGGLLVRGLLFRGPNLNKQIDRAMAVHAKVGT